MSTSTEPRWIRLEDIKTEDCGLSAEERIHVLATALEELGIAKGLILMHGPDRGLERYLRLRGRVTWDGENVLVRFP